MASRKFARREKYRPLTMVISRLLLLVQGR